MTSTTKITDLAPLVVELRKHVALRDEANAKNLKTTANREHAAAWEIIEKKLKPYVTASIMNAIRRRNFNHDNAEDALSHCFAKICAEWLSLEPKERFWGISFGHVMKLSIIDHLKTYNSSVEWEKAQQSIEVTGKDGETSDNFEETASTGDQTDAIINRVFLQQALATLTKEERFALKAMTVYGLDQRETAERLKCTDRTVRNLVTRAKQKIQAMAA